MSTLTDTLEEITLFRGMSQEDIESVAAQTAIRQFPKNTVIVSQGDETDSFYVIMQGKVDVFLHNDKGKEIWRETGPNAVNLYRAVKRMVYGVDDVIAKSLEELRKLDESE